MDCEHLTIRDGNLVIRDGELLLCDGSQDHPFDLRGVIETHLDGMIQQPTLKGVIR